jgi:hypothetical protein
MWASMKETTLTGDKARAACRAASLFVVGAALLLSRVASAAPIIEWDILAATGQTASASSSVPEVSGTDLTPVNVTPWPGGYCCFVAAADWETSAAGPDLTKYYEFSITAAVGYSIVYEDITLSLFRGIQGGNHGAQLWQLRASHDGYAGVLAFFDISGSAVDEQTPFSGVDISAVGTQPGTITFRLYGYDYTSSSDYSGLGNQPGSTPLSGTGSDLIMGGQLVPEPMTLAQVSLGLTMLALAGRRRSGR